MCVDAAERIEPGAKQHVQAREGGNGIAGQADGEGSAVRGEPGGEGLAGLHPNAADERLPATSGPVSGNEIEGASADPADGDHEVGVLRRAVEPDDVKQTMAL